MIVTIRLIQKGKTNGGEMTTTSVVNIVDLAGRSVGNLMLVYTYLTPFMYVAKRFGYCPG